MYVGRIREFGPGDWLVYLSWVGLMLGLVGATSGFLISGHAHAVVFPAVAWWVLCAIGVDGDAAGRPLAGRGVLAFGAPERPRRSGIARWDTLPPLPEAAGEALRHEERHDRLTSRRRSESGRSGETTAPIRIRPAAAMSAPWP